MADAGIALSVGRCGDAYDNAIAEAMVGLFKTEVIRHAGRWRSFDVVEYPMLEGVAQINTTRLLNELSDVPPGEFEAQNDRPNYRPPRQ